MKSHLASDDRRCPKIMICFPLTSALDDAAISGIRAFFVTASELTNEMYVAY